MVRRQPRNSGSPGNLFYKHHLRNLIVDGALVVLVNYREEQDDYAIRSYSRAAAAYESGAPDYHPPEPEFVNV